MTDHPPAAQLERSRAFDYLISATARVLAESASASQLGNLGIDLAAINESAILPNIRDGRITLQRADADSDAVVIVPVAGSESSQYFELSPSVLRPTPQRKQRMTERARETREGGASPRFAQLAAQTLAMRGVGLKPSIDMNHPAFCVTFEGVSGGVHCITRPVIFIDQDLAQADVGYAGGVMAHEEVHAGDMEEAECAVGSVAFGVYTELRAHAVSSVVFKRMCSSGPMQSVSHELERKRRLFGVKIRRDSATRFPPQVTKAFEDYVHLGVQRLT